MNKKEAYSLALILLFFLLFNPFVALIFSVLLPIKDPKYKIIFSIFFSISFALLFSSREFGVEFYGTQSTDDAANYISIFKSYPNRTYLDLFQFFLEKPSGGEFGYHFFYKTISLFVSNEYFIVWINHFIYFFILSYIVNRLSENKQSLLLLGYFFIFPISLYNIGHIWRQQFAVLLFYLGIFFYYETNHKKLGKYLIYSIFLVHLSSFFYIFIFIIFEFFRRNNNITKYKIILLIVFFVVIEKVFFETVVLILTYFDLNKLLMYAEGFSADKSQFFILLPIYIFIVLLFLRFESGSVIYLFFLAYILVCLTLPIAIPTLNSVYDRYINFSIPLIGLFFAKRIVYYKNKYIFICGFIIILLVGFYRLGGELNKGVGIISYIGNGSVSDPFLGMVKLIVLYLI